MFCSKLALGASLCLVSGCAPIRLETKPPEAPFRHVPIGIGEDYPKEARTLRDLGRDLEVLQTNGLHVWRISFPWDQIEPEPGSYDWSFWDDLVRLATEEYGIRLLPYVCYTPRWAAADKGPDFWRQPPKDNASFAGFLQCIVQRYKSRIHSWEIWNEPDNPEYWLGSVEQFEHLLAAGSLAVRHADPQARVVLGGLAWNLNFLEAVLTNPPAISNVDIINLHNYYETWSSDPLERIPGYVGRAQDLLRDHGCHQPLWMAEVGYSSFRHGARVSAQSRAFYNYEHTPAQEAASLFRVVCLLLASEKVSLVTWYRLHDLPATQEVIGDANNRYLGLLDEDNRPKPALAALRYAHSLFAGGFRCLDGCVRINRRLRSDAEVHAFQLAEGRVLVAGWLRTVVPGERGGGNGQAQDVRQERIALTFPFQTAREATVFDETGRERGRMRVRSSTGRTHLSEIHLQDGRVTVLMLQRVK